MACPSCGLSTHNALCGDVLDIRFSDFVWFQRTAMGLSVRYSSASAVFFIHSLKHLQGVVLYVHQPVCSIRAGCVSIRKAKREIERFSG